MFGGGGLLAAAVPPAMWSEPAWALTREEWNAASLFQKAAPSVLGIADTPKLALGTKTDSSKPPRIMGSGFVWDSSHVVTNFHVIDELRRPRVTFLTKDQKGADQHTTFEATLVGADPLSDIAVLQVAEKSSLMRPLHRGASDSLKPGQEVFALGNPFGLERSMSRGIISGVSRTLEGTGGRPISGIIQTDASINPGNSGGPLLDSEGAVIGVNSAILSASGTFAGVGLAIPIATVERNVASMITKGYVTRPSLGVVFAPDGMSKELGIGGAMVLRVLAGGPAHKAGMRAMRSGFLGDVIVGFEGKPVGCSDDVFKILDLMDPGKDVVMSVQRPSNDVNSDAYEYVDLKVRLGVSNSRRVLT